MKEGHALVFDTFGNPAKFIKISSVAFVVLGSLVINSFNEQ